MRSCWVEHAQLLPRAVSMVFRLFGRSREVDREISSDLNSGKKQVWLNDAKNQRGTEYLNSFSNGSRSAKARGDASHLKMHRPIQGTQVQAG